MENWYAIERRISEYQHEAWRLAAEHGLVLAALGMTRADRSRGSSRRMPPRLRRLVHDAGVWIADHQIWRGGGAPPLHPRAR